jgi:hypothetical protein
MASCSVGITKLIYQYSEFLGEIFRNSLFNGIILLLTGNEEKLLSLLTPLNVNCHASDGRKSTPLHLASGYNRTRIVQLLLQHGADVHAKVGGGYITLLWSIYRSKSIPPPPDMIFSPFHDRQILTPRTLLLSLIWAPFAFILPFD